MLNRWNIENKAFSGCEFGTPGYLVLHHDSGGSLVGCSGEIRVIEYLQVSKTCTINVFQRRCSYTKLEFYENLQGL